MTNLLDAPAGHAVAYRVLLDAYLEGSRMFWERRAREFEWVITGDRRVRPTPAQLRACPDVADTIRACRARASFTEASGVEFHETLASLAAGAAGMTLPEAERLLRAAIDRDDPHAIAVLEQTIDHLAPPQPAAGRRNWRATAA